MTAPNRNRAPARRDPRDLNARAIALAALGVIAALLLVAALARFLTGVSGPARPGPTATSFEQPRRLLSDPLDQRATFEREKRARLDGYGWVDQEHDLAHVPIDRAMQMEADAGAARAP